jgi:hypothetical protein
VNALFTLILALIVALGGLAVVWYFDFPPHYSYLAGMMAAVFVYEIREAMR